MAEQTDQIPTDEERNSQRPQYQQPPQRSTASANWRLKDGLPRAEPQPRRQTRPIGQPGSPQPNRETSETRLYVGNLLYSAQRDDVALFFTENGFNVVNLSMSIDPMTGRNPSYCFVDFESAEEASRAMAELNGKDFFGRAVRINPGVAKKQNGEQGSNLQTKSYNRGWKTTEQEYTKPAFDRYNRTDAPSHWNLNREPENQGPVKRLYVGNLPRMEPQSAVDAAIKSLFDPLGVEVTAISKIISPHESKKELPGDHYYLFVDLARAEDGDVAIEALDGKTAPWGGESTLRVNRAREQAGRKVQREQGKRTDGFKDWRTSAKESEQ